MKVWTISTLLLAVLAGRLHADVLRQGWPEFNYTPAAELRAVEKPVPATPPQAIDTIQLSLTVQRSADGRSLEVPGAPNGFSVSALRIGYGDYDVHFTVSGDSDTFRVLRLSKGRYLLRGGEVNLTAIPAASGAYELSGDIPTPSGTTLSLSISVSTDNALRAAGTGFSLTLGRDFVSGKISPSLFSKAETVCLIALSLAINGDSSRPDPAWTPCIPQQWARIPYKPAPGRGDPWRPWLTRTGQAAPQNSSGSSSAPAAKAAASGKGGGREASGGSGGGAGGGGGGRGGGAGARGAGGASRGKARAAAGASASDRGGRRSYSAGAEGSSRHDSYRSSAAEGRGRPGPEPAAATSKKAKASTAAAARRAQPAAAKPARTAAVPPHKAATKLKGRPAVLASHGAAGSFAPGALSGKLEAKARSKTASAKNTAAKTSLFRQAPQFRDCPNDHPQKSAMGVPPPPTAKAFFPWKRLRIQAPPPPQYRDAIRDSARAAVPAERFTPDSGERAMGGVGHPLASVVGGLSDAARDWSSSAYVVWSWFKQFLPSHS